MILEKRIPRGRILGEILGEVRRRVVRGERTLGAGDVEEFAARDHLYGQEVVSDVEGRGIAAGLTPEGYLRIRGEDGSERQVRAGSVKLDRSSALGEDDQERREAP